MTMHVLNPDGQSVTLTLPEGVSAAEALAKNRSVCLCGGAQWGYSCPCHDCRGRSICCDRQEFPCKGAAICTY